MGVLGGSFIFFKHFFFFKLHKNAEKAIFNFSFFLTLWWVAGAGDEGNTPKF